jgi:hypothetical protein
MCQRCEKKITDKHWHGVVAMTTGDDSPGMKTSTKTYDLCQECYRAVKFCIASVSSNRTENWR